MLARKGLVEPGQPLLKDIEGMGVTVTRLSPAASVPTRTFTAEVSIPNPEGLIKVGMFANAEVVGQERKNVLAVPTTAVRKEDGKSFVRLWQYGKATLRPVRVGSRDGKFVEIVDGVKEKDSVVVGEIPGGKP